MSGELLQQLDAPEDTWYALGPRRLSRMTEPRHDDAWARLLDLAPCGLVLIDLHAVIQFINPAAARLLGINTPIQEVTIRVRRFLAIPR